MPPLVIVCSGDLRRTFPPGRDIVVGRDVRADLRIPHPSISRAHAVLRCRDGQWSLVDSESLHGMFVGTQRVASVPVGDGTTVNLGSTDGPRLTFELAAGPAERVTTRTTDAAITIGRAEDNDFAIPDVLASRHHAIVVATPSGMQIRDANSANGTFVNGERIRRKRLQDNDIVTIGNVDFVYVAGSLVRRTEPGATLGGLELRDVGVTIDGRTATLLDRVTLTAGPGVLTAVLGPPGSGKSTLLKVTGGIARPTSGTVKLDGRDLYAEYESLRRRVGMVPHGDVVHRALTVANALNIAAKLRMPPDTTERERQRVVSRVLQELDMTEHADTRVDRLSGDGCTQVSIAMELLTEPSLVVLDEPTTGLDPALDRQVMTTLRNLADAGRVIVVVTQSLSVIGVCDQILLLAPGGKVAYRGAPEDVAEAMGSQDWADIYTDICADPDAAQRRFLEPDGPHAAAPAPAPAGGRVTPARFWHQLIAIAERQVQLILADRRHLARLVAAPIVAGLLLLAVGGEPRQFIVLLSFAAMVMGGTLSVRGLLDERAIYRHEQAAGLSPSAYLLGKMSVFCAMAVIQSALLVLVATAAGIGARAPATAAVLGSPVVELFVDVAATAATAVVLGLAISAASGNGNQSIALLAAACIAQLVFAGGFAPITGTPVLDAVAAFTPARWGASAMASTVDLSNHVPGVHDPNGMHSASAWWFDMAMLAGLALLFAGIARWRLRCSSG